VATYDFRESFFVATVRERFQESAIVFGRERLQA
jgi:hypothetical protein